MKTNSIFILDEYTRNATFYYMDTQKKRVQEFCFMINQEKTNIHDKSSSYLPINQL